MSTDRKRRVLHGVPAAPGAAAGRWRRIQAAPVAEPRRIEAPQVDGEVTRLRDAAEAEARATEALAQRVAAEVDVAEAGIFTAQAEMARDPELLDVAATRIRDEHVDAVGAIRAAAEAAADMLRGLDDDLIAARATDVLDVADRIARRLAGLSVEPVGLDGPSIVVAEDLAPSMTATLPRDLLLGIALEGSSPTAHASILARAYGIPAVVGVSGLLADLGDPDGALVMLDGATGDVVLDPDADDLAKLSRVQAAGDAARLRDIEEARLPVETVDGTAVELLANIGSAAEVAGALELGATGVGLFRTEFLFLERSAAPPEDEQAEAYGAAAEAFAPHSVTIRLLDIGGDKPIPYLPLPREENPFLGVRALRLATDRPEIFVTQLRACMRAARRGRIKVMAPMVADAADAALLIGLAERARSSLAADGVECGDVELGVMLEIPSAILTADAYLSRFAFASIGTNDLAQYTLAADRGNPALERYRDALHPAVLRLVRAGGRVVGAFRCRLVGVRRDGG